MQKNWKIILGGAILVIVIALVWIMKTFWLGTSSMSYDESLNYGLTKGEMTGGVVAPMMAERNSLVAKEESYGVAEDAVQASPAQDRLIIKTGSISMVVENVREAIAKISQYTKDKGGFVVSSNVDKVGVAPYGEIIVRIPVTVFDSGVVDVKAMGEVESETVSGQDVTEEFVDLDSQLKNLRATETQFLQIMQRAVKIEDVLAVQRELTWVRRDIETMMGRMKYLKDSASLSTLTVYLSTDPDVLPTVDDTNKWKPWAEVKSAARSLLGVGKGLVNFAIWLVVYIPLWLVIGLVVWGVVQLIRPRKTNI
ncbi:MAG TPA: DUF4349 domain-containing protein [Candidatus Magasanikbacteria bacterium]|nr:DUF4349 domain-containing protein [Candidatus Magasanikbacteria bacterium]